MWIEIPQLVEDLKICRSLPARGVWIEIADAETTVLGLCRSPQGECGLKSQGRTPHAGPTGSLPARGVWIEMLKKSIMLHGADGRSPQGECGLKYYGEAAHLSDHASLPARGVWIEINMNHVLSLIFKSLPARGVWIEMSTIVGCFASGWVAPRKGSVD